MNILKTGRDSQKIRDIYKRTILNRKKGAVDLRVIKVEKESYFQNRHLKQECIDMLVMHLTSTLPGARATAAPTKAAGFRTTIARRRRTLAGSIRLSISDNWHHFDATSTAIAVIRRRIRTFDCEFGGGRPTGRRTQR